MVSINQQDIITTEERELIIMLGQTNRGKVQYSINERLNSCLQDKNDHLADVEVMHICHNLNSTFRASEVTRATMGYTPKELDALMTEWETFI